MSRKSGTRQNEGNADMHADALAIWCGNKPNLATLPERNSGPGRIWGVPTQSGRESLASPLILYFTLTPTQHHFIDIQYCTFRVKMRFAPLGIMPGVYRTGSSLPLCVYKSAIPFLLCQYQNPNQAQVYST
jgi:hypothetical protein